MSGVLLVMCDRTFEIDQYCAMGLGCVCNIANWSNW